MNRFWMLTFSLWLAATLGFGVAEGVLTFSPNSGPVGTDVVATASGLPANATLDFVWATAEARWLVEDGHFYGQDADATQGVLQSVVSDKDGNASFTFTVPTDFGYVHNTTLVQGDEIVARQGFTLTPELSLSPTSGPLGTPITVTVTGLGFNFYQSGWHLMYDNAQTGWVTGSPTQGSATFTSPRPGTRGHTCSSSCLDRAGRTSTSTVAELPTAMAYHEHATIHHTPGPAVTPPDAADQTLPRIEGQHAAGPGPAIVVDFASGIVGSPIRLTGVNYPAETTVQLSYSSVRGNRISGGGWETVDVPWGSVKTDAAGGFDMTWPTPDDLAGARTITAAAGDVSATVDYTITPNVEALTPMQVAAGETFQLVLKGTGWSDTGNIYTVVIDNSYFGYACGFNTNGTIIINFTAPLEPGWHYLDLYPSIYQGTSDVPTTTTSNDHFQLPMLNAIDHPGEELPAFHLAFEVVGK